MKKLGEDIINSSGSVPFYEVQNIHDLDISAPEIRKGDALRACVHSLSGFQKEAFISSARTGMTWRLVSDEGDYLAGWDAAP